MIQIDISIIQWIVLIFGAIFIGMSKTSISAVGGFATPLIALFFSGDLLFAAGVIVPILIVGDICAIVYYKKHIEIKPILILLPWIAIGVVLGYFMEDIIPLEKLRIIVVIILIVTLGFSYIKIQNIKKSNPILAVPLGVVGGVVSMLVNLGGVAVNLYFLMMNMKKMTFVGSAAGFFLCMNILKLILRVSSQTVNEQTIGISLLLSPFVIIGGVIGKIILGYIPEKTFKSIVLLISILVSFQLFFL